MRQNTENTVQGFRKPISEVLISASGLFLRGMLRIGKPPHKNKESRAWFNGYMGALYALRANSLPPAYAASDDVRQIQAGIDLAIIQLENEEGN